MTEREKISPDGAKLGETIRKLRDAKGLRVSDLARALGVTEVAIKKLQRGSGTQHFFRLAEISSLLGTTPNELLGFSAIGEAEVVRGVLESSYLALDLSEAEARTYAQAVLEVMREPPIQNAKLQPLEAGRVQGELSLRKVLRPK